MKITCYGKSSFQLLGVDETYQRELFELSGKYNEFTQEWIFPLSVKDDILQFLRDKYNVVMISTDELPSTCMYRSLTYGEMILRIITESKKSRIIEILSEDSKSMKSKLSEMKVGMLRKKLIPVLETYSQKELSLICDEIDRDKEETIHNRQKLMEERKVTKGILEYINKQISGKAEEISTLLEKNKVIYLRILEGREVINVIKAIILSYNKLLNTIAVKLLEDCGVRIIKGQIYALSLREILVESCSYKEIKENNIISKIVWYSKTPDCSASKRCFELELVYQNILFRENIKETMKEITEISSDLFGVIERYLCV